MFENPNHRRLGDCFEQFSPALAGDREGLLDRGATRTAAVSVTSQRKRKKQATARGLTERELELVELMEEMLDTFRWLQILGYSNQYLVNRKLKIDPDERNSILEAATRAVEGDKKLHDWRQRLARLKGEVTQIKRDVNRARKNISRGRPDPKPLHREEGGIAG